MARSSDRVLVEDRLLQRPQAWTGIEAEVDQPPVRLTVGLECLGLATGAVQRQHELSPPPLLEWILRHARLELRHELGVSAELELRVDERLLRGHARGFQSVGVGRQRAFIGQIREWPTAPQSEGALEDGDLLRGRRRLIRLGDETIEPNGIDLVRAGVQDVPAVAGLEHAGTEHPAQLRDVVVERLARRCRRALTPHRIDQAIDRHDLARVQDEEGQERAVLMAVDRDQPVAVPHLQGAQDPKVHPTLDCVIRHAPNPR